MTSTSRVEVSLESTLDSVDHAEEMSQAFARNAGFSQDDQLKIGMAVREAMVNAVLHGNKWDPGKRAGLLLELEDGRLVVTVTDEGPGFDLGLVPDPLAAENLMKQSGRGIFLIRSFMDEIQVRRCSPKGGAEMRMVKYRSPDNGKEEDL
jgi:serine/threonine-protein kinase RsbW